MDPTGLEPVPSRLGTNHAAITLWAQSQFIFSLIKSKESMSIYQKNRHKGYPLKKIGWFGILEDMILILNQRRVIREVYDIIWKGRNSSMYKHVGISKIELLDAMKQRQFPPQSRFMFFHYKIMKFLNKGFVDDFSPRIEDSIEDSLKEGYLARKDISGNIRMTEDGRSFISWFWWVSGFTKHPLVLELVKYLILTGGGIFIVSKLIEAIPK